MYVLCQSVTLFHWTRYKHYHPLEVIIFMPLCFLHVYFDYIFKQTSKLILHSYVGSSCYFKPNALSRNKAYFPLQPSWTSLQSQLVTICNIRFNNEFFCILHKRYIFSRFIVRRNVVFSLK